ncbi:MAG: DEAD/DEAH box helicase, partial [Planctomycetales bacterium]
RGNRSAAFKDLLKVSMYDYQKEGALFAAKAGRSLLGDDMGLGKTIQALAAAEIMARRLGVERVLVVVPTSLKHQWELEIEKFTSRDAQVVSGPMAKRAECYQSESFYKITNYDVVHSDLDAINEWLPDLVILDEAQRIKNWATRAARSVKEIKSPYALVLTGTPLENRLEELVSLVQFIDVHRLGPTFRFLNDHQIIEEETGRVIGYRDLDRISETLAPVLLRRRKKEVLKELPDRLQKNYFVPMTPQQMEHHTENGELVARIASKWRTRGFLSESDQRKLMVGLQNMRMSCDGTYLLDHQTDHGVKADELISQLEDLLEDPEAKVVVFSQWIKMHELIRRRLEGRKWDHVFFHGSVPSDKRKGLIDRFRSEDDCRLFLSTDAGGVGLNLQHASAVVNMDLPWNPAVLEQRIGRVHRLGQKRPVQVINFVAQGTIEEGMLSVLDFKKSLFEGVLDGGEKEVFLGKSRLGQFIETVEKVTANVTAPVVEEPAAPEPAAPETRPTSPTASPSETPSQAASASPSAGQVPTPSQPADPLAAFLQSGLALLEQFAAASGTANSEALPASGSGESSVATSAAPSDPVQVARDDATGEPYLKVRMPQPEAMTQVLGAVRTIMDAFGK